MKSATQLPAADTPGDAGLITIYSNLGSGNNVYNGNEGNGIVGPDAGQLYMEWIGNRFSPAADYTVTEIKVGVTYVQGPNAVTLSLNENNHDTPGKALHTWQLSNLPEFGTCCVLQTVKLTQGIPVQKGKFYWVVLSTNSKTEKTYDVWNGDADGHEGPWSNDIGEGWATSYQQRNAFGVFGH
ncbi:MAG TPA: hypothetical protein VF753_08465 [Terriglobales bacterium]